MVTRVIYNQDPAMPDFREFLDNFEGKRELLSEWWSTAKRRQCERAARTGGGAWAEIEHAVEKSDIVSHYGDGTLPGSLRLLTERVEGCAATACC